MKKKTNVEGLHHNYVYESLEGRKLHIYVHTSSYDTNVLQLHVISKLYDFADCTIHVVEEDEFTLINANALITTTNTYLHIKEADDI